MAAHFVCINSLGLYILDKISRLLATKPYVKKGLFNIESLGLTFPAPQLLVVLLAHDEICVVDNFVRDLVLNLSFMCFLNSATCRISWMEYQEMLNTFEPFAGNPIFIHIHLVLLATVPLIDGRSLCCFLRRFQFFLWLIALYGLV